MFASFRASVSVCLYMFCRCLWYYCSYLCLHVCPCHPRVSPLSHGISRAHKKTFHLYFARIMCRHTHTHRAGAGALLTVSPSRIPHSVPVPICHPPSTHGTCVLALWFLRHAPRLKRIGKCAYIRQIKVRARAGRQSLVRCVLCPRVLCRAARNEETRVGMADARAPPMRRRGEGDYEGVRVYGFGLYLSHSEPSVERQSCRRRQRIVKLVKVKNDAVAPGAGERLKCIFGRVVQERRSASYVWYFTMPTPGKGSFIVVLCLALSLFIRHRNMLGAKVL